MSRKYNVSKQSKGLTTGIIIGLIGMSLVGALGALSKGFKDWNYKDWFNKTSETQKEMSRPIEVGDNLYNAVIELHLDDALKKFGEVTTSNQNTKLITFNTSFEQVFGFKENGGTKNLYLKLEMVEKNLKIINFPKILIQIKLMFNI